MNTTFKKTLFILLVVLAAFPFITPPMALIGGFLFTLIFGNPFIETTKKMTGFLLKASVVGLGFGLEIGSALEVGRDGLFITLATITTVMVTGYFVGRWLHIDRKLSHLISSGTAICGGSAIAAVAPAIEAKGSQITIALAVVFLLNSVALIIFPPLGHLLEMSQEQFGLWCAMAIHDTSSVVGAASTYGGEALKIATTVKLARALWVIPIALFSAYLFKSKGKKVAVPYFILLFVVAMALNSYVDIIGSISHHIFYIAGRSLVVTLFLIGSALSFAALRSAGPKPLLLAVTLWCVVSVLSLISILSIF